MRRSSMLPAAGAALALACSLFAGVPTGEAEAATANAAPEPGRPNVLLITADDMRADDLRFMPFTRGEFRRRAVTFSDAVSPYPLCCPARAQIVTGQYNHNNGVRGNAWPNGGYWALRDPANTLPVWLRRNGYRTGFVGKYMNGYEADPATLADPEGRLVGRRRGEVPPGWTHWYGSIGKLYRYRSVVVNVDGPTTQPRRRLVRRYQTEYFSDVTTSLIRRYARQERPFFIWASHLAPHVAVQRNSWVPPLPAERDQGVHRSLDLPVTTEFRDAFNASTDEKSGYIANRSPLLLAPVLRLHRARAESLRSLDRAVRAAVAELKRTGEYARTTILFTSDNGFMLGEHRYVGKDMPYEPALRVPMIVNGPGIRGRYRAVAPSSTRMTVPHTVTTTDIASTVTGITGTRPGRLLDGIDITRPQVNPDHVAGGDRAVLVESGARGPRVVSSSRFVGVRTDRWTWLAWRFGPGADGMVYDDTELYDRRFDPAQVANLSFHGQAPDAGLDRLALQMYDCRGSECVVGFS